MSVQSPEADVAFMAGVYERRRGRKALRLREDFSGSAALSAAWVASDARRTAVAIDNDPRPHAYARAKGREGPRLRLLQGDVSSARPRPAADVSCAYNFSVFELPTRKALVSYLAGARRGLAEGGLFFLDVFGGITAQQPSLETRETAAGHTYIWEQASFDPLTSRLVAAIHFRLPGGRLIEGAFRYDWRLWQIAELVEALEDAGFARSDVYWEDRDEDGEPTGRFRRRTRVEAEPAWNAYVVAER